MDVWCCSPSTTIIVYNGKYNWFVELPNAFSPKEFLFCRFFYLMLLLFYHFFCLKRFSPISPVQPLHFMFHPTATCITRVMLRWEAPFTEEAVDGKIQMLESVVFSLFAAFSFQLLFFPYSPNIQCILPLPTYTCTATD